MSNQEQNSSRVGEHVTDWLGAYHDGEVNAALRARIEAHLAVCPDCQRELDGLRQLSVLLQAAPAPLSPLSDEAYARAVVARSARPLTPLWQRGLRAAWRFAPLFLFAAWAFFQAVQWMSAALLFGLRLVPGWQAWLPSQATADGGLLADLLRMSLPGGLTGLAFDQAAGMPPLASLALLNLAFVAVLALLFLSWLASWWAYHRARVPGQL